MSAELLGILEKVVSAAVRALGTYKIRKGECSRAFGGVNVVICADFWQLHPVTGTFLASNPLDVPAGCAQRALELFWNDGKDSIRHLWQLTQLMRCDDKWYNTFLAECREGRLTIEKYSYLHGLPTLNSPCEEHCKCKYDREWDGVLGYYRRSWRDKFMNEHAVMSKWLKSTKSECPNCRQERQRRHRVVTGHGALRPELYRQPFVGAPALYTFNVPRYFATNLRAREYAKQSNVQLTWCYAKDEPLHPEDRELARDKLDEKLFSWLKRHDQETGHIPSIYPLAVGMPVRLTENADRGKQLYRGRKGQIYGWTMASNCIPMEHEGEFILDKLPQVIYIQFADVDWKIGDLPVGVFSHDTKDSDVASKQSYRNRSQTNRILVPG